MFSRSIAVQMAQKGGDAILTVRSGESTYNPETSSVTTSEKSYVVRVLAFDYIQKGSGITSEDGTLIKTGDKQFLIKPDPTVPVPDKSTSFITFQGRKWRIVAVKEYNPSGSKPYLYEVYARF